MLVSKLGEFGLIERIRRHIKTNDTVIQGIGDDCAVVTYDKTYYELLTCDMLVEGIDFLRNEKPYLIGRKALAVSMSDIAACGGSPWFALISLGIPNDTSVEFIDKLFQGMRRIADTYHVNIVGGDTSKANCLVIDVSMLGMVQQRHLVLRSGAKKGDIIFVTGKLGGSIKGKHLRFTPRLQEANFLVGNFKINSMIDISDGLIQDLGHILKESKAGAIIYEELIPLSKNARNLEDALYMGEDFELLFTISHYEARKLLVKRLKNFRPIGEIVDRKHGLRLVDKRGRERIIRPGGFQHF